MKTNDLIALVLAFLLTLGLGYASFKCTMERDMLRDKLIAEMIEKGYDPISVRYAFLDGSNPSIFAVKVATKCEVQK